MLSGQLNNGGVGYSFCGKEMLLSGHFLRQMGSSKAIVTKF